MENCNFSKTDFDTITLTDLGVLVQGPVEQIKLLTVTTADQDISVTKNTPLLIQSNKILEISTEGSSQQIKTKITVEQEYILETWLTDKDLDKLDMTVLTQEILDELNYGLYIDIVLIILMSVVVPVLGCIFKTYMANKDNWSSNSHIKIRAHQVKHNLKTNRKISKVLNI